MLVTDVRFFAFTSRVFVLLATNEFLQIQPTPKC